MGHFVPTIQSEGPGRLVTAIVKNRMDNGVLAEAVESIGRVGTWSPDRSRRYPRFSPGAGAATCTYVYFPPKANEPFVQSSAGQCM
jgi:hypothetical protein